MIKFRIVTLLHIVQLFMRFYRSLLFNLSVYKINVIVYKKANSSITTVNEYIKQ